MFDDDDCPYDAANSVDEDAHSTPSVTALTPSASTAMPSSLARASFSAGVALPSVEAAVRVQLRASCLENKSRFLRRNVTVACRALRTHFFLIVPPRFLGFSPCGL